MPLNDKEMRLSVREKLAARRIEATLDAVKRHWWRPLITAGTSLVLGGGLLSIGLSMPEKGNTALAGAAIFAAAGYVCFWAFRQNRVSRAIIEKLEKLEGDLEDLIDKLENAPVDGGEPPSDE